MSSFTNFDSKEGITYDKEMSVRYQKDLYRVLGGFRFYIGDVDSNYYVDVEDGFITDGATVPRFLWWLIPPIGSYTKCTSLHDKLCSTYIAHRVVGGITYNIILDREEIDDIFKESLKVNKDPKWIRFLLNAGVALHRWFKNPKEPKPVYRKLS